VRAHAGRASRFAPRRRPRPIQSAFTTRWGNREYDLRRIVGPLPANPPLPNETLEDLLATVHHRQARLRDERDLTEGIKTAIAAELVRRGVSTFSGDGFRAALYLRTAYLCATCRVDVRGCICADGPTHVAVVPMSPGIRVFAKSEEQE
jgi:hypothetical protein